MHVLKQISAVTLLNLKSVPMRLGASSVIVIGIAGVVGVLVSILAMVAGLTQDDDEHWPAGSRHRDRYGFKLRGFEQPVARSDANRTGRARNQAWRGWKARRVGRGAGNRARCAEGRQPRQPPLAGSRSRSLRASTGTSNPGGPDLRAGGTRADRRPLGAASVSRTGCRQQDHAPRSRLVGRRRVREQRRPARSGADHRRRNAAIGLQAQRVSVGCRPARLRRVICRFQLIIERGSLSVGRRHARTGLLPAAITFVHSSALDGRVSRRWHHGARRRARRAQLDVHGRERPRGRDCDACASWGSERHLS